jgi:hypothetical protein
MEGKIKLMSGCDPSASGASHASLLCQMTLVSDFQGRYLDYLAKVIQTKPLEVLPNHILS